MTNKPPAMSIVAEHTQPALAQRMADLQPSLVREILAAATRPGMISFAGGLPAPDLMPELPVAALTQRALYQYGASEGEPAFREAVAEWIGHAGLSIAPAQVLALAGSQQGLDLCAKLLIDPGSTLLVEAPTYLAALQVFQLFGARIRPLPMDTEGIALDALEAALREGHARALYLVPSFQNPSGLCYSAARRQAVAALLDRYGCALIEDDPYRSICLDVTHPMRAICSYLQRAPWVYLGSFSKILWPGMRIGYLAASPALMPHLLKLKQANDLHTQRPGQIAVAEWLKSAHRDADLARLIEGYRIRRDAMQAALQTQLGDIAEWSIPQGGLFFWLRLRTGRADRALLDQALAEGVAFMPGGAFYPTPPSTADTMRLNYSHATPEAMSHGLAILSRLIRAT